ncbi:45 kDa calcium-binding protein [Diachasmimorpha longicaudata]|uniref:45 kDa calcium-binding protein n=1 Tax=Diachasmimorpha longicaudata TaxID=58733 RepID=UPI0030B8AF1B
MRKPDLRFIRLTRWTILVPLVIYVCFVYIKYNNSMRLKSSRGAEGHGIQELVAEVDSAVKLTNDERRNEAGKSDNGNAQVIRDIEDMENKEHPKLLLEDVFRRADTDENQELSIQELSKWIHAKIIDHINRAMRENVGLFTAIDDDPRNGEISWEEYHAFFLRSHGFSEEYISSHDKKHSQLPRSLKESIMRDRARWIEAARTDPEKLALDEFLAFTHPESSHRALLQMVEDLFEKFDRDGDEQLTENEFADLPSDGIGGEFHENQKIKPVGGSEDRRQEFRHLIDKNKDGQADRTELLMYIDPRNPRHAIQEAQHLIEVSDINHDRMLSLSEVLSKMDLFLDSKMVDTEKSFHDEFR